MNVVFTGGGTGGHIYPAIAIADALRDRADITFVGTADRLEASLVPKAGYALETVASRPLTRKLSLELLRTAFVNLRGTSQAMKVLSRVKPDIVIATGGYVCFPVVLAARLLGRRPIALLELNAHPGLTNRLLAPLVDEVWGAFTQADARFAGKYVHTGIPVRAGLRALPARDEAVTRLGLSAKRQTLLAIGGSQGARSINDALTSLLKSDGLPANWQLIHVTGEKEYDRVRGALRQAQGDTGRAQGDTGRAQGDTGRAQGDTGRAQGDTGGAQGDTGGASEPAIRPYLHDLTDAFAAADLVLARAGASTLGELAATGRPAILVPYPHAADGHQLANATEAAATGAAVVVEDRELAAGRLRTILAETVAPSRLAAMRAAAEAQRSADPVATILARVAALTSRKSGS